MMVTVKGPTAGAVVIEWNVAESSLGSAGMWGKSKTAHSSSTYSDRLRMQTLTSESEAPLVAISHSRNVPRSRVSSTPGVRQHRF
jgi:hypothetical protein